MKVAALLLFIFNVIVALALAFAAMLYEVREAGDMFVIKQRDLMNPRFITETVQGDEFMLLRPVEGESRYFVLTRWESEEAFQAWRTSREFQHQHAQTHTDGGAGEAKPNHPVATGASLLSFEVVTLTSASE